MKRVFFPAILLAAVAARGAAPEQSQLDANETLFAVMAAINAAGYDAGISSPENHPLRAAVRQELARRNIAVLPELKRFVESHHQANEGTDLAQYVSFALSVKGPPDFAFKERDLDVPPDALALRGLAPLMARFYNEADVPNLWQRSQGAFDQYIERYHDPVAALVLQVNSYLRAESSIRYLGRRFQIYIDLLGPPNQVQTRSYGYDYYVVVTPSREPRIEEIRHAYLFFMLDPLALHSGEVLKRKAGLIDHAQRAPLLDSMYKSDFLLLATASLVKAVEARLDHKPAMADEALRQGFILVPYFFEQLAAYEKQEQSMRFFYPEMVQGIDLVKEDARLGKVEFASRAPAPQVQPAPAPPPLTGAAKTLEDGEDFIRARNTEKARQAFLQALQQTDEKPLHARAYYGLARVAALENDPELAERMFEKTLESSPDAQVKSWTEVYLGRLADAAGDRQQAVRHYQEALAVTGATEGARKAAEQGIQETFQKPEK